MKNVLNLYSYFMLSTINYKILYSINATDYQLANQKI